MISTINNKRPGRLKCESSYEDSSATIRLYPNVDGLRQQLVKGDSNKSDHTGCRSGSDNTAPTDDETKSLSDSSSTSLSGGILGKVVTVKAKQAKAGAAASASAPASGITTASSSISSSSGGGQRQQKMKSVIKTVSHVPADHHHEGTTTNTRTTRRSSHHSSSSSGRKNREEENEREFSTTNDFRGSPGACSNDASNRRSSRNNKEDLEGSSSCRWKTEATAGKDRAVSSSIPPRTKTPRSSNRTPYTIEDKKTSRGRGDGVMDSDNASKEAYHHNRYHHRDQRSSAEAGDDDYGRSRGGRGGPHSMHNRSQEDDGSWSYQQGSRRRRDHGGGRSEAETISLLDDGSWYEQGRGGGVRRRTNREFHGSSYHTRDCGASLTGGRRIRGHRGYYDDQRSHHDRSVYSTPPSCLYGDRRDRYDYHDDRRYRRYEYDDRDPYYPPPRHHRYDHRHRGEDPMMAQSANCDYERRRYRSDYPEDPSYESLGYHSAGYYSGSRERADPYDFSRRGGGGRRRDSSSRGGGGESRFHDTDPYYSHRERGEERSNNSGRRRGGPQDRYDDRIDRHEGERSRRRSSHCDDDDDGHRNRRSQESESYEHRHHDRQEGERNRRRSSDCYDGRKSSSTYESERHEGETRRSRRSSDCYDGRSRSQESEMNHYEASNNSMKDKKSDRRGVASLDKGDSNDGYNKKSEGHQDELLYLEVAPGVKEKLRGSDETRKAVESDYYDSAACWACCTSPLFCIADAAFFVCPECKSISPLENYSGSKKAIKRHGVGLAFTRTTLVNLQEEIARERTVNRAWKAAVNTENKQR